jgi:hypothetical protein
MNKALRKTLKISGILLGALVFLVLVGSLLALFDKPLVRSLLRRELVRTVGPDARFAKLDYSVFPFRVIVDGLEIGSEDTFQKLEATVTRLEARGSFGKLIRGIRPALETFEASGVSFRLEEKARSETSVDIEKALLQVSDMLAWARRIAVTDARLSFALLSGPIEVEHLDLTMTEGPTRDVVTYSIGRGDVSVKNGSGALVFAAGVKSSGRLGLVSPFGVDVEFGLNAPRFNAAGLAGSLGGLTLALTGRLDRPAQELKVSHLKIDVPGLLGLEGTMTGRLGHGIFLEAEARARFDDLAAAAGLLGRLLPAEVRTAAPRGRADLSGTYILQRSNQGTKDNLTASLSLESVELDPRLDGRPVHVRAAGRIETAGPSSDPRLSADIRVSTGPVAAAGISVKGADLRIVGSGTRTAADISLLQARLAEFVFDAAGGRRVALETTSLTAKGTVDLARKEGVLTSLEARLPGLAPLRLAGRYGSGKSASSELRLDASGLDVPALRALAAPFIPADIAGWDLGGALDLSLFVRRPSAARDEWRVSGTVALAAAKFNDPSFTVAGEGLDPVLRIEASGSASKGLAFKGSLGIGRGESLWKSVYIAWTKHPLKLEAAGRYVPGTGVLDGVTARILVPEVGSIDIAGSAALGPAPAFDLSAEARLSLGPLYSLYTQAGVSEEARMKLEGVLGATVLVRKSGQGLSAAGRIRLADTNIESPTSKTLLVGITADLPLHYESAPAHQEGQSRLAGSPDPAKLAQEGQPPAGTDPEALLPEQGFLRIGEFQNPLLNLKPVEIAVRAGTNALSIEPLSLPVFGGRLELGRTTFRFDPATGAFRGLGSLALRALDISKFPIQSPEFKLTGKVEADFPGLDIGADRIAIAGRGEARVFGGTIVLRDLAVANPFASGRSISLDVDLVDLDLKKLTDEVPFGEVTGIVQGEIRGLVFTYGQPETFSLRIESVPRKGVPQTFSLKAVDNLTVISSGQTASGGTSSFWMKFIRGFRYEKLGIVSTLRNDSFTLNGTIHEGGIEYLVKKPSLFGISVVNREPGKKISFKEMTGRLKRVGQ